MRRSLVDAPRRAPYHLVYMSEIVRGSWAAYEAKKQRLSAQLQTRVKEGSSPLALSGKSSSNLFRHRTEEKSTLVNVKDFHHVITIDPVELYADVEGMTTYEEFVRETLAFDCLPTVVPELKSITVGGAATGIGIESSSFKFGLVHETITEMDILLGDGQVVTCTATNEHKNLFFGFPNSYGSLGYALRLRVKLVKTKKFVKLERSTFETVATFLQALQERTLCGREDGSIDYIEGVAFAPNSYSLTTGTFIDEAPYTSDYTYSHIYYKSILEKPLDYLTTLDYIWRWDTDWFWCSRFFGVEHTFVRKLLGRDRLRSTTYWKIRRFFEQHGLVKFLEPLRGRSEPVIQDVEIPFAGSEAFLDFFQTEIGIKPIWVCPTMAVDPARVYDLYDMDPHTLYLNFGFWDGVKTQKEEGYYNRLIEAKVEELEGKKSLYSTSYYSTETFWKLYNKARYQMLKQKYDPQSRLKDLYQKCVLRK